MSYFPPPPGKQATPGAFHIQELFFEQTAVYNILATDTEANPKIFAKWQITRDGLSPPNFLSILAVSILTILKLNTGLGGVSIGLSQSDDGITWNTIVTLTSQNPVDNPEILPSVSIQISDTSNFLAISASNNDGATTGTAKRFSLTALLHLSVTTTIIKVL